MNHTIRKPKKYGILTFHCAAETKTKNWLQGKLSYGIQNEKEKLWETYFVWSEVHIRAYDAPDDGHFVTETYVGQS